MKYKLAKSVLVIMTVFAISTTGCKKSVNEKENSENFTKTTMTLMKRGGIDETISDKIVTWLNEKSKEGQLKSETIASVLANVDFGRSESVRMVSGEDIISIPIKEGFRSSVYLKAMNSLVVTLDKDGNIKQCNIIQFVSSGERQIPAISATVFVDLFSSKSSLDGKFIFLNLADIREQEKDFRNGRMVSYGTRKIERTVKKSSTNSSGNMNREIGSDACITIWWVHTDVYIDHIEREITLIGTFCNGEDGSGGGGNGGTNDNCYNQQEAAFRDEINNSSPVSEDESANMYDITPFTKHKDPKWKIFDGFGGWSLHSQEVGIIKLVDVQQNIWNWESLTHGAITLQGSTPFGVSISYTQGIGTPSVYSLYAGMSLNYTVTYSFLCNCPNIPILGQLPINETKAYNSAHIWDAKPI